MRPAGKTKAMVMALPAGGACVVCHSGQMAQYIKRMIFDLRGKDVFAKCKVMAVTSHGEAYRLSGLCVPTFIDHAFDFHVPLGVASEVEARVGIINALFERPVAGVEVG